MKLKEFIDNSNVSDEVRRKDLENIAKIINSLQEEPSLQGMVYIAYSVGVARGESAVNLYQAKQSDIASAH